jgi:hypothetical protein
MASTMAERVRVNHEIALVLLGQSPAQFWRSTPAETANLITAFRRRSNRHAMRKAWEVYHVMRPHLGPDSTLTVEALFRSYPGAFPEDMPASTTDEGMPAGLNPRQQAEWRRRRDTQRVQAPPK